MISFLNGNLAEKLLTRAVVEVNDIGFKLSIPMSTYDKLPSIGEKILLYAYLHVRQDIMQLYGFSTEEEKSLFLLLITYVSGVGPKLALNILSSMPVKSFASSIIEGDVKALSRINGIGKRSAERLVIELKDKIQDLAGDANFGGTEETLSQPALKAVEDAISGLITLGFKVDSARKTIGLIMKEVPEEECTPELLIRKALMVLNS